MDDKILSRAQHEKKEEIDSIPTKISRQSASWN